MVKRKTYGLELEMSRNRLLPMVFKGPNLGMLSRFLNIRRTGEPKEKGNSPRYRNR